ncbi:MAG: hypothetical protein WED07_15220 [Candidatus Freyarchaeum deiterrae]
MQIDGIVIIDSVSGVPLFSKLDTIDSTLFSGFVTAIRNFSSELSLGGLSSFSTEEKNIFLAARRRVVTAIIASTDLEFQKVYSLAYQIGAAFEDMYELTESPDQDKFKGFSTRLEGILKEKEVPFLLEAAEFAKKEFGGAISIRPELKVEHGKTMVIDLVVDRGKRNPEGVLNRLVQRRWKAFSEDITFVKVIDGIAGRGEVMDFIDSLRSVGEESGMHIRNHKDRAAEEFPYFPARAAVVARDYSPTVFEEMEKLLRVEGKACIAGDQITRQARGKYFPDSSKCFIELWKWKEGYPERVFC